jgi:hypothetical protein
MEVETKMEITEILETAIFNILHSLYQDYPHEITISEKEFRQRIHLIVDSHYPTLN